MKPGSVSSCNETVTMCHSQRVYVPVCTFTGDVHSQRDPPLCAQGDPYNTLNAIFSDSNEGIDFVSFFLIDGSEGLISWYATNSSFFLSSFFFFRRSDRQGKRKPLRILFLNDGAEFFLIWTALRQSNVYFEHFFFSSNIVQELPSVKHLSPKGNFERAKRKFGLALANGRIFSRVESTPESFNLK